MAVLIEAIAVVMRRETINRRYEGGWPRFVADAVNGTLCADSDIAQISFMHPDDVHAFIQRLARHGFVFLDANGAAEDIVVVDQHEGPKIPCTWIEFLRLKVPGGTVSAARLTGSSEKNLACPTGWKFERSLSIRSYPGKEPGEKLEFVRHQDGIDVFRDRQTGEEVYLGRPTGLRGADEKFADADNEAKRKEYKALCVDASNLLMPYFGRQPASAQEATDIAHARELLERITSFSNATWQDWWLLGFARRLLKDRQSAYAAFSRAYGMAPNEVEVGRNLAMECIALGYGPEAIAVSEAMTRLMPGDAGLAANHALALFVGGHLDGALCEVQRAEQLKPGIAIDLRKWIEDVRTGRVEAPSSIPNL
jgi:hypothetical protein